MTVAADKSFTAELGKKIAKATGLSVEPYRRNPVNGGGFIISLNGNTLRLWAQDGADVEIHADKKLKQAVLVVKEPKRVLTQNWNYRAGINHYDNVSGLVENANHRIAGHCPLIVNAKGTRQSHKITEKGMSAFANGLKKSKERHAEHMRRRESSSSSFFDHDDSYVIANVQVHSRFMTPASEQYFLIGFDEHHCFISELPEKATSVAQAHKVLRPKGLSKAAIRHGEWFMTPATKSEIEKLQSMTPGSAHSNEPLENGSNHRALILRKIGKERFVTGQVYDTRKGRHEPVFLNKWYKLVRNREVFVAPSSAEAATRRSYLWD